MTTDQQPSGRYVYAITATPITIDALGLNDAEVTAIDEDGVYAIVSPIQNKAIRPQRKHLAAHQRVVADLAAKKIATLPVAFGVIADDEDTLRDILSEQHDTIISEIRAVDGCVEFGVRLSWDVENIFEHFVAEYPELRSLRDELAFHGEDAPHQLRVKTGEVFSATIEQARNELTQRIMAQLDPTCEDTIDNGPKSDTEVLNIACLVRSDNTSAFEAALEKAAESLPDHYAFALAGPWPPHHFVSLNLGLSAAA